MNVIRAGELREFALGGQAILGLASPSRGARELTLLQTRLEPGACTPPHHHDREELLVLASGELEVVCGDEVHRLGPGEVAVLPPHVTHSLENVSSDEAVLLLVSGTGARSWSLDGSELPLPPWLK